MMKRTRTFLIPALLFSLSACDRAQSPVHPKTVDGTRPSWATPDRLVGPVSGGERIELQVHLAMRNQQQAEAALAAMSDPDSATYGQFLTDEQYNATYAPTDADVAAVRDHLIQNGLTVGDMPANRTYIEAVGTASQIERAFSTKLGLYKVGDDVLRAPEATVKFTGALQSRVAGVFGLSTPQIMVSRGVKIGGVRPADVWRTLHPNDAVPPNTCSEWFGAKADNTDPVYPGYPALTYAPCGYRPAHIREAYGLSNTIRRGIDGTGQSIAIVDAYLSPTLVQDAQTYAANEDPDYPLADGQITTQMAPGNPTTPDTGWYGEQSLDVEAVHAIAPGAKIVYVGAQSATDKDLVAAINLIVSNKLATIISNSYGMVEQGGGVNYVVWHNIATQAGLKGIGIYFSSGDNGDESQNFFSPGPSADFPASLDNVVAVGGTSLALSRTGTRTWELGWETGASRLQAAVTTDAGTTPATWSPAPPGQFVFGSGGGTSVVYSQPTWQAGVVPDAIANLPGAPARAVPDVAMVGDPLTGYLIGQTAPAAGTYSEFAIGGTSLSCPLFAATMALAQQNAKKKFGFSAPLLYKKRNGSFNDIAPSATPQAVALPGGIVATFDYNRLTIHPAAGWDNVTGLGTPGPDFLKNIK